MAVRPLTAKRPTGAAGEYAELAVKCDLCRSYEGPACVQACPTESIFRINPSEEITDVRQILRGGAPEAATRRARGQGPWLLPGAAIAALGIGLAGAVMQARERW